MSKILSIARVTSKEMIQGKSFFVSILMILFLLIVTYISMQFSFGNQYVITIDIALGLLNIEMLAFSVLLGVGLITQDIENKTIFLILSKPVSRSNYLLGKVLGISLYNLLNIFLVILSLFAYFKLNNLEFGLKLPLVAIIIYFESVITVLLCLFFSLFSHRHLAAVLTFAAYIFSTTAPELLKMNLLEGTYIEDILNGLLKIIPQYNFLDLKDRVFETLTQGEFISLFFNQALYAVVLIGALITVNTVTFNHKNVD